jgi:DNA-binding NarL/FixJ family response regulator
LPLTAREQQVLQLLAEGRNTKAIALHLSLSPKTVDWHKSQLMKKLRIDSLAGLVRYAIQEGLSPLAIASSEATA